MLLILGLSLRIRMIHGQLPYIGNMDEVILLDRSLTIIKTGDLNPKFFNYPSFPLYLTSLSMSIGYLNAASQNSSLHIRDIEHIDYPYFNDPRLIEPVKLLFSFLSIVSIFLIAVSSRKFFNLKHAVIPLIIGMALLSERYFFYSQAYVNVDIIACFWIMAAYAVTSFSLQKDSWAHKAIIPGIASGLAMASKYNMAVVAIPMVAVILFYSKKKLRQIILFLSVSALTFVLAVPFSVLDYHTFINHLGAEVRHYRTSHEGFDGDPGISQLAHYGKFILNDFGVFSVFPFLIGMVYAIRAHWRNALIFVLFPVALLCFMSTKRVNFIRNSLSVYVFYAVFVAIGFYVMFETGFRLPGALRKHIPVKTVVYYSAVLIIGLLLFSGLPLSRMHLWLNARPDTRKQAIEWIKENIDHHSTIVVPEELYFDTRPIDACYDVVRVRFLSEEWDPILSRIKTIDDMFFIVPVFAYDVRRPFDKKQIDILNGISSAMRELAFFSENHIVTPEAKIFSDNGVLVNYYNHVPGRDPTFGVYQYQANAVLPHN
jgi:hypothetical protein